MDYLLVIFSVVSYLQWTYSYQCGFENDHCEIWFNIENRLTMTWNKLRVYAKNHQLYKFDEHWENATTKVPNDEVIMMDGVERSVIAVNNSVPGPPIIAYEGQELIVHVKNNLLSEAITIHWHGLHQKGTPFMDGVAYITQCPIEPGQTFTYRFKAEPHGTFWYHSHIGGQRVDGLFGALIIKPRHLKENALYKDAEDIIMHVGDWFHIHGYELHTKMIYGNFKSQPGFIHPRTLDGVYYAPLIYEAAHIEGKGNYLDPKTGKWTENPLTNYFVEKGRNYRFRVINTGTIYPLRISIDGHLLTVVSSDGYDVKPTDFESLIINPGERFDFILKADQEISDYWIRAHTIEEQFKNHYVQAILRYNKQSNIIPSTERIKCTKSKPCNVLNCPFKYFPLEENTICIGIDELHARGGEINPVFEKDSVQMFQNWHQIPGGMGVNGKLFVHSAVNSLTQPEEMRMDLNCDLANCKEEKVCSCQHEIDIPYNKTIQMIWTNHGSGATRHHPIHLHGHSFHVLKIAFPEYNTTSGLKVSDNKDIKCANSMLCNNPSFDNKEWYGNNIPALNLIDPPQKDTLMVPAGAYAVIRFKSNNPGKWSIHCHIEFHSMQGMTMIMNEAKEKHVSSPPGFPICQNFYHNNDIDNHYVRADIARIDDCIDTGEYQKLVVCFIAIIIFIVLENILLLLVCLVRKWRKRDRTKEIKKDSKKCFIDNEDNCNGD